MNKGIRELLENWNNNIRIDETLDSSVVTGNIRDELYPDENKETELQDKIVNEYVGQSNYVSMNEKMKYNIIYDIDQEHDIENVKNGNIPYEYKVKDILKTDDVEFSDNMRIYIVPFAMTFCRDKHPFLSYLTYIQNKKEIDIKNIQNKDDEERNENKDENENEKSSDNKNENSILIFPHLTREQYKKLENINDNKEKITIQKAGESYFNSLFGYNIDTLGYIKDTDYNEYYLFYDLTNELDEIVFQEYRRNYKWKWISTGEIMYTKKVLEHSIFEPIVSIFGRYKELIYVFLNSQMYMLPLTLYNISNVELDNNVKYPITKIREEDEKEQSTFLYSFLRIDDLNNVNVDEKLHISRYFVFYRKVFIKTKSFSLNEKYDEIYFDNFDCFIDNGSDEFDKDNYNQKRVSLKSNEQFMFVDSNFYSK